MGDEFVVSASTGCVKVNLAGTDENQFRLRALPLELVPFPGHCAGAPTKGYVRVRTPNETKVMIP